MQDVEPERHKAFKVSIPCLFYDPTTGEIIQTGGADTIATANVQSRVGTNRLINRQGNAWDTYVNVITLEALARPEVTYDRSTVTRNEPISFNTPVGTKIYRDGTLIVTTTESPYVFRHNTRGTFNILVDPPFPHRPLSVVVIVT